MHVDKQARKKEILIEKMTKREKQNETKRKKG